MRLQTENPVVRGTPISVEPALDLLAAGLSAQNRMTLVADENIPQPALKVVRNAGDGFSDSKPSQLVRKPRTLLLLLVAAMPLGALQMENRNGNTGCNGFQQGTFAAIEMEKPLKVRSGVRGTIEVDLGGGRDPQYISGALFQVCSKQTAYEIIASTSDSNGNFQLNLPAGRYRFVAAKPGYQSINGTLIVSPWALPRKIRIRLPLGL